MTDRIYYVYDSASEHLQHVLTSSVKPRFVVLVSQGRSIRTALGISCGRFYPNQVFIHYTGWYCGSRENPQSMQLDSVRNDFIEVLKYLRCTPAFPHSQLVNPMLNMGPYLRPPR